MDDVKPRWEWRSFGPRFGKADAALAALDPRGVQESDELYLLHGAGSNVKVRDALIDIKVLLQVDEHGLEQWRPVMKRAFPLTRTDVSTVLQSLQMPHAELRRERYTLEELIADFGGQGSGIRAVSVHKRRVRCMVDDCTAELTDVKANGESTRTIALESDDPAAVVRALSKLGLTDFRNTSYPRGLTGLIAQTPPRYGVIDVGTNSVKFHLGERDREGRWRTIIDRAEVTRLGEGLAHQGGINDAAIARTAAAMAAMVDEARRHEVRAIAAVGTAGLRLASNGPEVVTALRERTGVHLEVIPGEEETRLAYLAARSGLGVRAGTLVVFDTGGGSSQFTFGHDSGVDERFSVNVGAVAYTERYGLGGAVSSRVLQEALAAIAGDLARLDRRPVPDALVGMGGAVTNLTAVLHRLAAYDPAVVQGTVLDRTEVDRQIELYRTRDAAARRSIIGLQPKRADVILAGACIVRTVMEKLGREDLIVSDRGLRHGVLEERFDA
jgi:exopolyphosphatase/guanosine-5'-triphosphate,3'-diphosphate pyrophosphatase